MNNTIVGLDIGTTKVTAVVGEVLDDEEINIIGVGVTPSAGMHHGVVVSIEETTQCIQRALDEAQRMADMAVDYVYIGVSGKHIHSLNHSAVLEIDNGGGPVTQNDRDRILELAQSIVLEPGYEILHCVPKEFSLDGQGNINDPVGMIGSRLEVFVHIVLASTNAIANLAQCATRLNLDVAQVILQPLASAEAVLNRDERNLGVILVDIGGGTTDVAVFRDGKLEFSHVIPVGGWNFSRDLAEVFHISQQEAERIKMRYGCVNQKGVEKGLMVEHVAIGSEERGTIPAETIAEVLSCRAAEVVSMVLQPILDHLGDLSQFRSGMVITGGGSQIRGLDQLFREQSGLSVRLGRTRNVTGLVEKVSSPIYATAVGLILFGYRHHEATLPMQDDEGLFERLRAWFRGIFVGT